jgi:hypothetical protein
MSNRAVDVVENRLISGVWTGPGRGGRWFERVGGRMGGVGFLADFGWVGGGGFVVSHPSLEKKGRMGHLRLLVSHPFRIFSSKNRGMDGGPGRCYQLGSNL